MVSLGHDGIAIVAHSFLSIACMELMQLPEDLEGRWRFYQLSTGWPGRVVAPNLSVAKKCVQDTAWRPTGRDGSISSAVLRFLLLLQPANDVRHKALLLTMLQADPHLLAHYLELVTVLASEPHLSPEWLAQLALAIHLLWLCASSPAIPRDRSTPHSSLRTLSCARMGGIGDDAVRRAHAGMDLQLTVAVIGKFGRGFWSKVVLGSFSSSCPRVCTCFVHVPGIAAFGSDSKLCVAQWSHCRP